MTTPPVRLGRGLAALLGDMAPADTLRQSTVSSRALPIEMLEPSAFQPRLTMDETSLEELAASIRTTGVLQPLLVRPHPQQSGRYEIIAGERRWRAAQKAGLSEVPVLIRDLDAEHALAAALVENLQRQDLNAIEEADGYRRLQAEFGLTQEQLSFAIGKSRSHIANSTRLLKLPEPVQHHVRRGALSAGHARALLAHIEPLKGAMAVISRGLNVRQTEDLANRSASGRAQSRQMVHLDIDTKALEQSVATHLGTKVTITTKGKRGTLHLHYESLDQLEGLVALLLK